MRVLYDQVTHVVINDIYKMIRDFYPEIEFVPYQTTRKGDVFLGNHTIPDDAPKDMRRVVSFGSMPHYLRNYYGNDTMGKLDHVAFVSDFVRKIILSEQELKSHSVILWTGSLPCDNKMKPFLRRKPLSEPIHFVACAKFWRRKYKRKKQIVSLYEGYLKKLYPNSYLHILGSKRNKKHPSGIIEYFHSFEDPRYCRVMKRSHLQIVMTPFDTGPHVIGEALHYRVPFVVSNNCAGPETIELLGDCGKVVESDRHIDNAEMFRLLRPLKNPSFYDGKQNYELWVETIREILDNYEKFTSWQWNSDLNYESQAKKWYGVLTGESSSDTKRSTEVIQENV